MANTRLAEDRRRSGRATKGQHTRGREDAESTPKKGQAKGKKAKAEPEPEEEDEYIRCVCGLYEEEEDNPRSMICCDKCSAWQHNECMGLPEDYQPDKYYCEQCKKSDHKKLLAAMSRGEKPWEEAAKRREAAEAEKAAKKKGKKGRKSAGAQPTDVERTPTLEPEEANSKKRKHDESPVQEVKVSETPSNNKPYTNCEYSLKEPAPRPENRPHENRSLKIVLWKTLRMKRLVQTN